MDRRLTYVLPPADEATTADVVAAIIVPELNFTGQFGRMLRAEFWREIHHLEKYGGVMGIAIHPYLVNQPHRQKAFEDVIAYMRGFDDVWWTRGVDIADWYYDRHFDAAQKAHVLKLAAVPAQATQVRAWLAADQTPAKVTAPLPPN